MLTIEQRSTALCILLQFYVAEPKAMYVEDMNLTERMWDWLTDGETLRANDEWPEIEGVDTCASCDTVFGATLGGRLRQGCFQCKCPRDSIADPYTIQELAVITQMTQPMIEFLLAVFLNDYRKRTRDTLSPEAFEL